MEILKTISGNSLTIGFVFPFDYALNRIEGVVVTLGGNTYPNTIDENIVKVSLTSKQTSTLLSLKELTFTLDDTVFGVKKLKCGYIKFESSNAGFNNESINEGFNLLVNLSIFEDTLSVESVLYDYVKGDSSFRVWQLQEGNADKTIDDYFDYLMQPALEAAEIADVATASANYAANTANEAAELANSKATLADQKATLADQKATLADNATTNANNKAQAAETATTNANAAEGLRVTAEQGRVISEGLRVTTESSRVSVEGNRVTAEQGRVTAENSRVSAESTRGSNETTRISNENTRISQETARVNAEAARVSAGSEVKTNMSTNIETDKASTTKYPQLKALYDWATGRFLTMTQTVSQTIGATGARLAKLWATDVDANNIDVNSKFQMTAGNYLYNCTSLTTDTVNDRRRYNNAGVMTYQRCTVANATKGAGTWVTDMTVGAAGVTDFANMPTVVGTSLSTTFAAKSSITDYIALYQRKIATVVNGVITAIQDTIAAHNSRVTADLGALRDSVFVKKYYDFCYDNQMFDSIKFAWLGAGGSKFRINGIYTYFTKIYSMLGGNDAVQATSTSQPYLSGNIAPNEKYTLKNPNGGSNFLTHTAIPFTSTESWTLRAKIRLNGFGTIQTIATGGINTKLRFTTLGKIEFINESNTTVTGTALYHKYIGKNTLFHAVAGGSGTLLIYANGVLIETLTIATNATFTTQNSSTNPMYGVWYGYILNAQALTQAQITAEYNLLRSNYPEIESVVIGTQTWATSNCEMVATPMGNIIANVTDNTAWATSQTIYNDTYAATSGTVEQKTYAAVKAAAMWCHYNNDIAVGSVYGKLYNWFAVKLMQMDIDYYNAANPTALWGWKVPALADYTTLSTYLGGDSVSGSHLKKEGTAYWYNTNTDADNTSGFSAIGANFRNADGSNSPIYAGCFLSITDNGNARWLNRINGNFSPSNGYVIPDLRNGFSIRLIKV